MWRNGGSPGFKSPGFSLALPERFKNVRPGSVTLGIRPENVGVRLDGASRGGVELPLRLVEPMGKETLLYFDDGSDRHFVVVSEGLAMAQKRSGGRLGLTFAPEHIYLFGPGGGRIGGNSSSARK